MWSVHTTKGSLLHRKNRRILLTLDSPSGSLTWVTAAPFIVSGLAAAWSHNQGHMCLCPIVLTPPVTLSEDSRFYTRLWSSHSRHWNRRQICQKNLLICFMEKGKPVMKLSLLQKGGASSHQKGCHAGQEGGNRKGASPWDSPGSPPQAETRPRDHVGPGHPHSVVKGKDTRPSQSRPRESSGVESPAGWSWPHCHFLLTLGHCDAPQQQFLHLWRGALGTEGGFSLLHTQDVILLLPSQGEKRTSCVCVHVCIHIYIYMHIYFEMYNVYWTLDIYYIYIEHNMYCTNMLYVHIYIHVSMCVYLAVPSLHSCS